MIGRVALAGLILGLSAASNAVRAEDSAPTHCNIDEREAPAKPGFVSATVRGPATPAEIRDQTLAALRRTHAQLSPAYLGLPRIYAVFLANGVRHGTIAAVIDGHIPAPGEVVKLASRHRDRDLPCHFIPWTVVPGEMV